MKKSVKGLRCVGAAIRDHDGNSSYAISVSGPKSRMTYSKIQDIGHALADSAGRIAQRLGHPAGGLTRSAGGLIPRYSIDTSSLSLDEIVAQLVMKRPAETAQAGGSLAGASQRAMMLKACRGCWRRPSRK